MAVEIEQDETRNTYDKIAKKWADAHYDSNFWGQEYAKVTKYAGRNAYVLDVGCGPGRDVRAFVNLGYSVIGIDYSDGMLKEAKKRVINGTFIKMDMRNLEFGDGAFDVVWSCASFLHISKADASSVLSQLYRVLRYGGIIFIAVKRGIGEEMKEYPDGTRRFFAYYIDKELDRMLERIGMEVLESYFKADSEGDIWLCVFAKKLQQPAPVQ